MEVTRVRCPICGALPTLENLEQTAKEKPAEVRIVIQRFGGKEQAPPIGDEVPYKKRKRGSAPGKMEYEDVTEQFPEQVKEMEAFFSERIELFQKAKG